MGRVVDILVRDLQGLLHDVGRDGGVIGPSVYDTAMVARLAPPKEGPEPAIEWLLSRQQSDGGWCSPRYPIGRDLPTLAAVLALREHRRDVKAREACAAGLAFLREQAGQWTAIPDDLPIALELTLPALVQEAIRQGVDISPEPYRLLAAEGERKRKYILRGPVVRGTPAAHAWEALGLEPTLDVVDEIGSVGTSPASTAAWLSASVSVGALLGARAGAAAYLERAARSTGSGVPGVVPHAFPIPRFEQSWVLLGVLSAGLYSRAELAGPLNGALDDLELAVTPRGVGYADVFVPDGDDTACAVAALKGGGREVSAGLVRLFEGDGHFFVFTGERNPSPSANAHAIYALSLFGEDAPGARRFLVDHQSADGRFQGDKWHTSWLYTTHRAVLALDPSRDRESLLRARSALCAHQHEDGGLGSTSASTPFETAHGVLALHALAAKGESTDEVAARIERGYRYLLSQYRPFGPPEEPLWIAKEIYSMPRVDRAFELCAMLAVALELGA